MASGWGRPPPPAARRWRLRGPAGCLLLVVILVIILLMLSILFGGLQLGKKAAPTPRQPALSLALQGRLSQLRLNP
jgi:hypothetical protein